MTMWQQYHTGTRQPCRAAQCRDRNRPWKHQGGDRRFARLSHRQPISLLPSAPVARAVPLALHTRAAAFLDLRILQLVDDGEHERASGDAVDVGAARACAGAFAQCVRLDPGAADGFFGYRRTRLHRARVQPPALGVSRNVGTGSRSRGAIAASRQAGGDARQSALVSSARSAVGYERTADLLGLAAAAAATSDFSIGAESAADAAEPTAGRAAACAGRNCRRQRSEFRNFCRRDEQGHATSEARRRLSGLATSLGASPRGDDGAR